MKTYRVGTEIQVLTAYIDPVTHVERVRVKHGIVTAVASQTRMTARIGHSTTVQVQRTTGNDFYDRVKQSTAIVTVHPVAAATHA